MHRFFPSEKCAFLDSFNAAFQSDQMFISRKPQNVAEIPFVKTAAYTQRVYALLYL